MGTRTAPLGPGYSATPLQPGLRSEATLYGSRDARRTPRRGPGAGPRVHATGYINIVQCMF